MTINEAKIKLKEHGYSIVTIYNPKQSKIEVHLKRGLDIVDGEIDTEENCNKFLIEKAKFILI